MSETSHTPGPWEAAERGDYADFDGDSRVILGDDRRIAVVQDSGSIEDAANARLIAAAPDMLEALHTLIINNRMGVTGQLARAGWAKARAAISKAEGPQP